MSEPDEKRAFLTKCVLNWQTDVEEDRANLLYSARRLNEAIGKLDAYDRKEATRSKGKLAP